MLLTMMFLCGRCDYVQVPVDCVYIMLSLRHDFCAFIMQPPIGGTVLSLFVALYMYMYMDATPY